jgi:arylsulfatase A-like enzyme
MRPAAVLGIAITLTLTFTLAATESRPNILFILTDDQRFDALGCAGNEIIQTPNLDKLAERGLRFENAFVTLSICSPCRAVCMTGQYNSRNGVTQIGNHKISVASPHLPKLLGNAGYRTAMFGKWHMGDKPADLGFQTFEYFTSNGPYYGRTFKVGNRTKKVDKFIDDYVADKCIDYLDQASKDDKPFFLWMCTQVPHMNHKHEWNARPETLQLYADADIQVPKSWSDDLSGKLPYLEAARSRQQALKYGYDKKERVVDHIRRYYAAVTEVDASIGRVLDHLKETGLDDNTWIVFMGDNGWLLGEHQFTSKVLAYEESIRVPMIITGPKARTGLEARFALNIDLAPTILDLAGVPADERMDGTSLVPILQGKNTEWRDHFVYEAPVSQLGTNPLWAVRTKDRKYIATHLPNGTVFEELYDLQKDPVELQNLATRPGLKPQLEEFRAAVEEHSGGSHLPGATGR